ncbi:uncharacterized protein LOC124274532 isoform X2 [Haliotis rubra]|uniref:uncharacterized protein LOC124274532 isoform X2 n=1 Tax=Haliotis rubra TaxID=36100 RepID=UPI001EE58022|nr:uncharacterized protein LOC124274532 isoform X2 [Haliotis rubra]
MWLLAVLLVINLPVHEQCSWGIYGENCDRTCPSNCYLDPGRNLRHCQKYTGKCSEGCVRGYHGDQCNISCSGGCLNETCNHGNGHCTLGCKETYIGDFCNETSGILAVTCTAGPDDNNLAAILVPVLLIILILCITLAVMVFKLRSRRRAESKRRYPNNEYSTPKAAPLRPHYTVPLIEKHPEAEHPEADPCESPGNEDTHKIVPDFDKQPTDQPSREKDISDLFVETEGYREVKDKLETLGHVIISGGPGAGKTSMALMLGAEFRRHGYEVVLVEDVGTFQLSDCLCKDKDVCVIFDDVFQSVGPSMDGHPAANTRNRTKEKRSPEGAHSDVITARLAEAVADGTFSNYIMHPIWKMKEVADKVNQMFPDDGTKSHDTKHGILHYACFMGNNDIIDRLLPHCDINRRAVNGWTPVMFAVTG